MKYYKDSKSNIYAYAADGSQDDIIPSDYIKITEAEKNTLLEAKKVADEQATLKIVPSVISRFQAMSILEETEITYNDNKVMIATAVQSYVDSLDSSTETNRAIKRAWNYASEFERTSSTITAIAALLSLTDKQVDDMFIAASKIKG